MAKVAAEAAGRQAASFVLGCVAALTVVVLILQRRPEELTRPRAPVQFFGSTRSSSSPSAIRTRRDLVFRIPVDGDRCS